MTAIWQVVKDTSAGPEDVAGTTYRILVQRNAFGAIGKLSGILGEICETSDSEVLLVQ